MTPPLLLSAIGTPRPQKRPRFVNGRVVATTGKALKLWRAEIAKSAREAVAARGGAPAFTGAIRITMRFTFLPPADRMDRLDKLHTHKPDRDNLEKAVLDELEAAGVFKNDSQCAIGETVKRWGRSPGVIILIESVDQSTAAAAPALPEMAPDWLKPRAAR